MAKPFNYSKWDHIGDSEDEEDRLDKKHKSEVYHSLQKVNQELLDYAAAGVVDEVEMVLKKGAMVNSKLPQNGNTALHLALWLQHHDVARALMNHPKADLEVVDNDGMRPLHTAAWAAFEGDAPMVEELLKRGVEKQPVNNSGLTPLHLAASVSQTVTDMLLAAGCNPLTQSNDGETPLQYARRKGGGVSMKYKQVCV
eukprot:TRINITY_DN4596_c0_g1_i1.p2 TRINITY_DN4596_c0_g1~~TRINITY_DN4596_c0_g1_i1.p2  ORF type:complete len:198 (+),score=97.28 TRINITY_DN4596_c0_g1_i1:56-649(+)